MNQEITAYIDAAPADQKAIMESLRQLIHETVQGAEEEIKWGRPVFSKAKDFAYLKTEKNYVTLGFFSVKNLEDPNNLLEGTGKDMRHIKIKTVADINKSQLVKWLKASTK